MLGSIRNANATRSLTNQQAVVSFTPPITEVAAAVAGELVRVLGVQSLQTAVDPVALQDSLRVVGQGCPHSRLYCTVVELLYCSLANTVAHWSSLDSDVNTV